MSESWEWGQDLELTDLQPSDHVRAADVIRMLYRLQDSNIVVVLEEDEDERAPSRLEQLEAEVQRLSEKWR